MGQKRRVFLDPQVKLLMVFHASRLDGVKSIVLTSSYQRSLRFLSTFGETSPRSPCLILYSRVKLSQQHDL